MTPLRLVRRVWYLCSARSSAPHTRYVLPLMTLDMRSQNSRSSPRGPCAPCVDASERLLCPRLSLVPLWCSSMNALIAFIASFGWMSSPLSASATKKERSFCRSAAPCTPSTLRIESIFSKFCSSTGSGSSNLSTFCSTRNPASSQSSPSMRCTPSLSTDPRELTAALSAEDAACVLPPSPRPATKSCSDGGNQCRPSCCSWMILSACSTLRISPVTISSFICHTSR
mmetsp:Transcript_27583/g.82397  ORF Transcript_27583/g.82397 Transcript_27583/m.82397 type:complete len:227 (+) Transcript_27583:206-886(+)